MRDLKLSNTRVVQSLHNNSLPGAQDLPNNRPYARYYNKDKEAINTDIVFQHLSATHSKDPNVQPPLRTMFLLMHRT